MLPMIAIVEYIAENGSSPFGMWFADLDPSAAAVVTVALARLADGNTSNVKAVGEGLAELRIDRGPGFRVYHGWDGKTLVVLLGGGTKRRQSADIAAASGLWRAYKARKTTSRTKSGGRHGADT
jgi:putative addiction module killer protein